MNRLIIVGSPRVAGRSAQLADLLFEACIEEYPEDEVALAPVSTLDIAPCQGCDACRDLVRKVQAWADSSDDELPPPARCVIDDDMVQVYDFLDAADEVVVVSPVYFAGVPSQLKAMLDRMQPYFWTDARKGAKRPATLHVVGEGGDPHGFEPLVGTVRSALSCVGFDLVRVLDWVGKISIDGEIVAEAGEYCSTFSPAEEGEQDAQSEAVSVTAFRGGQAFEGSAESSTLEKKAIPPTPYSARRVQLNVNPGKRHPSSSQGQGESQKQRPSKGSGRGSKPPTPKKQGKRRG